MFMYHMKTQDGIKYFNWALLLTVICQILVFLLAISLATVVSNIFSNNTVTNAQLGTLVAVAAVACGFLVIYLISLIFFLVGIIHTYQGKDEFGPEHSQDIGRSIIFMVFVIVMAVIPSFASSAISMGSIMNASSSISDLANQMMIRAIVSGVCGILSSFFIALFLIFTIRTLVREEQKRYLWVALVLLVMSAVIGFIIQVWLAAKISAMASSLSTMKTQDFSMMVSSLLNLASISSIVALFGYILFYKIYRETYFRIASQDLKPVGFPQSLPPEYHVYTLAFTPIQHQVNAQHLPITQTQPSTSQGQQLTPIQDTNLPAAVKEPILSQSPTLTKTDTKSDAGSAAVQRAQEKVPDSVGQQSDSDTIECKHCKKKIPKWAVACPFCGKWQQE